jgi:hypothetical protein
MLRGFHILLYNSWLLLALLSNSWLLLAPLTLLSNNWLLLAPLTLLSNSWQLLAPLTPNSRLPHASSLINLPVMQTHISILLSG